MRKSIYNIPAMDCPSEEQLIRMKLAQVEEIRSLVFDIPGRKLSVYHTGDPTTITTSLATLGLGSEIIRTEEADAPVNTEEKIETRLLWQVLWINFGFFAIEVITGWLGHSLGLVADGFDMLADSMVYGLAIFAVGRSVLFKKRIAAASGYLQLLLAAGGMAEVLIRYFYPEETPAYSLMILVSVFALIGNAASLYILRKSRSKEVYMKASIIFTSNDVLVNLGVIVAGGLVYLSDSRVPDLVVGLIVFTMVGRGAFRILKL